MTKPNQEAYLSETLSAVMDGEASDLELRRLLKACESDESIKQAWARMQLARSVIHREALTPSAEVASFSLSQRIAEAVAQEEAHEAVQPTVDENHHMGQVVTLSPWRRALSGLGRVSIAASVAAGVLYVAGNLPSQDPSADSQLVTSQELSSESLAVADATIKIPAQDRVLEAPIDDVQPANMPIGHRSGLLSARTVSTGEFSPVQASGLPSALPRSEIPVSYLYLDDYVNYLKRRAQLRQRAAFPLPMEGEEIHPQQDSSR